MKNRQSNNAILFPNIILVSLFVLCILIPNLHFSHAEKSETENRMLAKYVPLVAHKKINWNYGANFEKFYNDRFFMRSELIGLNSHLKQKLDTQKFVYGKEVMQGKDGWLFYRGAFSELNFLNYNLFDEAQLQQGLKYLSDIKSWCDTNGKFFVFLICPDKNKIYGEYFPDGYKKLRPDTESRAFQFVNYVRANSDIPIVYPYNTLHSEKQDWRLLYYKNDTHWNYDGAYIAYKELMKILQKSLDVEEVIAVGFDEEYKPKGDLNNLFPEMDYEKYKYVYENIKYYKPKINSQYRESEEGKILWAKEANNILYTLCEKNKYNAIFFRDSFTSAVSLFTSNTFKNCVYHWRYNITLEDLAYIKDNADVVVLECVERYLPSAVSNIFPRAEAGK